MREAQLKTGHFESYFMRFWFLFKSCVLLGLSVGADGPPHHRRAEIWEVTRPPPQEGASQLLGVGCGLYSTGDGEGPDCSPGLPWNHLSGEGESCLTTTGWVWGSPLTLGGGGRVSPTQPLGCDPGGSGSVGMLSYNLARGSPQSALVLCWHAEAGPQLFLWHWLEQRLFPPGSWGFLSKPVGASSFQASPEWDIWTKTKPRDTWWFCFLSPKTPSQPVFSPPFGTTSCLFYI